MIGSLDSIILVGAQAIYLHTGAADLVVAEFTIDADFSVAIDHLQLLFGARSGAGIELTVRATRAIIDPEELTLTLITLTGDLMGAL